MRIGERLLDLRHKTGASLQQVADGVGVSKAHIWELEKGRSSNPSFDLVQKLAGHFGVSIDFLVGDGEEPSPDKMRVERIHRAVGKLTERDQAIVEEMIRAMSAKPAGGD